MYTENLSNEKPTVRAPFEIRLDPLANFFDMHTFAMRENGCTTTYNIQSGIANEIVSSAQRFIDFRKRLGGAISVSKADTIRIHFTVYDMSTFFERGQTSHARIVVTGPRESSVKENLTLLAGVIEDLPDIIKRDFERYLNFYLKVLKIAVEEATFNNDGIKVVCDFEFGKMCELAYDFTDGTFKSYRVLETDTDIYRDIKPLESVEARDIMERMYPDDKSLKPSKTVKMDIDEKDDETERIDDDDENELITNLDITVDPLKLLLEHWPYYESYEIVRDESVELFDKDYIARILKDDIEMAKEKLESDPRCRDVCCTFCSYRELEIDTITDKKYQKYKKYIPSVATKLSLAIYDVLCEHLPIARIVVETYNTLQVRYAYPIDAHRLYAGKPTMKFFYVGKMSFEYRILEGSKILPGLEQLFTNLKTTVVAHLESDVKSGKIDMPTFKDSKSIFDISGDPFVKIDPLEILLREYPMQEDYWEFKNGNQEIDRELIRTIIQEKVINETTDDCGYVTFVIDHYDEIHLTYAATKENQRSLSYLRQMVNDMTSLICSIIIEEASKGTIDKWEIQKQQNPMISIIEAPEDISTICPTSTVYYKDKSLPLTVKDLEAFYTGEEDFEMIPKIYNPNRTKVRYMMTIDPFEILLNLLSKMEKGKASAFMNGALDLDESVLVNYIDDHYNGVFTWLIAAGKHHPYELDYEVCYSDTINICDYRQGSNNFRVKDLIDSAQSGKLAEVLETITKRMVGIVSRHFRAVFTSYRRYKYIGYTIQNDCVSITTESSSVYVLDKNPSINLLSDLYDTSTGITIKDDVEITKQYLLSSMNLELHEVDESVDDSSGNSSDTPTMLGKQETYTQYLIDGYNLKSEDEMEQLLDDDDDAEESMEEEEPEEEDDGFNVIQVPYDPLELFYNACNRGLGILMREKANTENTKGWMGRLQLSPIDIFNQFFGVIFRESFIWEIFQSSAMVKNNEAFEKYLEANAISSYSDFFNHHEEKLKGVIFQKMVTKDETKRHHIYQKILSIIYKATLDGMHDTTDKIIVPEWIGDAYHFFCEKIEKVLLGNFDDNRGFLIASFDKVEPDTPDEEPIQVAYDVMEILSDIIHDFKEEVPSIAYSALPSQEPERSEALFRMLQDHLSSKAGLSENTQLSSNRLEQNLYIWKQFLYSDTVNACDDFTTYRMRTKPEYEGYAVCEPYRGVVFKEIKLSIIINRFDVFMELLSDIGIQATSNMYIDMSAQYLRLSRRIQEVLRDVFDFTEKNSMVTIFSDLQDNE